MLNRMDAILMLEIWKVRPHICICCGNWLGNYPRKFFFHHLAEKRNYHELRYVITNIVLVCWICHTAYEDNPDNRPLLKELKQDILNEQQHSNSQTLPELYNPFYPADDTNG